MTAIVAELRKQPGDGITPVTSAQIAYTPISTTSSWLIRSMFRTGLSRVIQTPGDLRRTAFIGPLAVRAIDPVTTLAELRKQPGDGNCSGVAQATR